MVCIDAEPISYDKMKSNVGFGTLGSSMSSSGRVYSLDDLIFSKTHPLTALTGQSMFDLPQTMGGQTAPAAIASSTASQSHSSEHELSFPGDAESRQQLQREDDK